MRFGRLKRGQRAACVLDARPEVVMVSAVHTTQATTRSRRRCRPRDDRALTDAVDRRHDALDLRRRHPLARHLEHVVRAPKKLEGPVGVLDHLIAGREPLATERPPRALGALPYPAAMLSPRTSSPPGVPAATGTPPSSTTRTSSRAPGAPAIPACRHRPVREEDVQRLGGAEAVEDLLPKRACQAWKSAGAAPLPPRRPGEARDPLRRVPRRLLGSAR